MKVVSSVRENNKSNNETKIYHKLKKKQRTEVGTAKLCGNLIIEPD
jgi:hypothetical protein